MLSHGGLIGAAGAASGGGGSITVDAATVDRWTNNVAQGASSTSASFTPPNNSLLVVFVSIAATSTNLVMGVSGGGLTWTKRADRSLADGSYDCYVDVWTAPVTTGASMTISCARSAGTVNTGHTSAKCYIVTGHNTSSPIDQVGEGSGSGSPYSPTLLTATAAGRTLYGATESAVASTITSSDTEDSAIINGGDWSTTSAYKASDHSSGDVTGNLQSSSTPHWNWVAVAIKAA